MQVHLFHALTECYNRFHSYQQGSGGSYSHMEKLEEVLRAEESARHVVVEARARVREIRTEAAAEAELMRSQAVRQGAEKAAVLRSKILHEADAQAATLERDAEHELGELVRAAETRLDAAARAVLDDLVG